MMHRSTVLLALAGTLSAPAGLAQVTVDAPAGRPAVVVDLRTREGVALVGGQWRYSDARIVEVAHRSPGSDLRPSGPPNRTHDIEPKAGVAGFDDSGWTAVDPLDLEGRRGTGRLSFGWYRIAVTIPDRIGSFDPTGSTAIFEIVVDDYAEVWVNGKLPVVLGQTGGALVKGFNSPNRIVLTREAVTGGALEAGRGQRCHS